LISTGPSLIGSKAALAGWGLHQLSPPTDYQAIEGIRRRQKPSPDIA
jgi:hypothetical protein